MSSFAPTPELEMLALRALVEQAPTGMCLFDYDLRYLYINDALAEINGIPVDAHIGQSVPELLPAFYANTRHLIDPVIQSGIPLVDMLFEGETPKQPGVIRSWLQSWTPIHVPGWVPTVAVICREVTEERRLTLNLAKANRQKDALLATVAHELRNPLAPLANAIHMLGLVGTKDTLRVHDLMRRQLHQLTRLVDDLMDASRIQHGALALRRSPIDVRDVIAQGVTNVRPAIDGKDQQLQVDVPERPLLLDGDAVRLTQVVSNLVQNASKFTEREGSISIHAFPSNEAIVIRVTDTGRGIPPDKLEQVFTLFSQLANDDQPNRHQEGLGIGLALARAITTAHGGNIRVQSDGLGHGTSFDVTLPRSAGPVLEAN